MIDAFAQVRPTSNSKGVVGQQFVLELSGGRIHSTSNAADRTVIVADCYLSGGIVFDVEAGHIYWTSEGAPGLDGGSIERVDFDGRNRRVIVPQYLNVTPKQLHLEKQSGKLYWSDREGMRVMRSNLDGTNVETLVRTGEGNSRIDQRGNEGRKPRNRHVRSFEAAKKAVTGFLEERQRDVTGNRP